MSEKYFLFRKLYQYIKEIFFFTTQLFFYHGIIFRVLYISRLYTKLWKELEIAICIRVKNFARSVNF